VSEKVEKVTIELDFDTTMLESELAETEMKAEEVEKAVNSATTRMISQLRSVTQMTFLFLAASGVAIDQTLLLWAESLFLLVEAATIAASVGGFTGIGLIKAGAAPCIIIKMNMLLRASL